MKTDGMYIFAELIERVVNLLFLDMCQKYLSSLNVPNLKTDLLNLLKEERPNFRLYHILFFSVCCIDCLIQYVELGHFRNINSLNLSHQTELPENKRTQWIKYLEQI